MTNPKGANLPFCHPQNEPAAPGGAVQAVQGQQQIINYLTDAIRNAGQNEQILHGACLGLGMFHHRMT